MTRLALASVLVLAGCSARAQEEPHPYRAEVYGVARGAGMLSTVTPSPVPTAGPEAWGHLTAARVTHYGESYNGRPMGCGGTYWSDEPAIVAVGPAWYSAIPCGTYLRITGPAGTLVASRTDSCPGCGAGLFDLSEAGQVAVCGVVGVNCEVTVEVRRN